MINKRSGVGSQFQIKDLNGDGAPNIVLSCFKETFVSEIRCIRPARIALRLNSWRRTGPQSPDGRLSEKPRSEVVEASPPRQPLVGGAGRFEIHIVNACAGQRGAEILGSRSFDRADTQE